jgi:hypothetical protein
VDLDVNHEAGLFVEFEVELLDYAKCMVVLCISEADILSCRHAEPLLDHPDRSDVHDLILVSHLPGAQEQVLQIRHKSTEYDAKRGYDSSDANAEYLGRQRIFGYV